MQVVWGGRLAAGLDSADEAPEGPDGITGSPELGGPWGEGDEHGAGFQAVGQLLEGWPPPHKRQT